MPVSLFDPRRLRAHANRLMSSADAARRVFAAAAKQMPAIQMPHVPGLTPQTTMRAGTFTSPAGTRPYRLFVPAKPAARPALIVMLHGCGQTADDFAAGTRMNEHAARSGALVLYPMQVQAANAQRCWNWFSPAERTAGAGEVDILSGMVRQIAGAHGADPKRVFVAGLSAGGAFAQALGAGYPDLFAAVGVHSGLACGAAHDVPSAFAAMRQGRPGQGRHRMRTIIFHGDADTTVNEANAQAVADQVAEPAARLPDVSNSRAPGGLAYTRSVQRDRTGRAVLERWTVHGGGHAWSGGDAAGSFTEPRGPDASEAMLAFFLS